jgi:hypothetical protein
MNTGGMTLDIASSLALQNDPPPSAAQPKRQQPQSQIRVPAFLNKLYA